MLDYEGVDNDNDDMCGAEDSAEEDKKEMCIQVTRKGLEKKHFYHVLLVFFSF